MNIVFTQSVVQDDTLLFIIPRMARNRSSIAQFAIETETEKGN